MRLGLRPVRLGSCQRLFLFPEGVFAAAGPGFLDRPVLAAPVSSYVQTLVSTPAAELALHPDVLGQAGPLLKHIDDLGFCLGELVPFLRERKGRRPLKLDAVAELVQRGREIERGVEKLLQREPDSSGLAESLGAPCAIVARAVIPLERATRKRKSDMHVEIDGRTYRYALENTYAISEFKRAVAVALRAHVRDVVLEDPQLKATIREFRTLLRMTLRRFMPSKREGCSVLYQDDEYQLQQSAGVWLLVRGPLQVRVGSGTTFVVLRIHGRTRQKRLSISPAKCTNPRRLWRAPGIPAHSGLCMGTNKQYERLLSNRFTESEAVLQWLDAGVILATGRSEYHMNWHYNRRRA